MGKKNILDVKVNDVEKRRYPTKHYVYVLEVNWSEGSSTVIYRRYSDFFAFQCLLLEKFPIEAGSKDPTQRMIPFLPGKKLLGRSHIRAVAEKRKEKIDEYCRTLIRLPPNISDSDFVQEFFEVRQTDLEKPKKPKSTKGQPKINEISDPLILERYVAIADYEKQKKNECSISAGQTVEVIDKNENGWWFVNVDDFNEGWVPATYLEPLYGSEDISVQKLDPGEEETWISMNRYEAKHPDELSFEKGVLVEVFEKGIDGWWKVRYKGEEGMAPAAYLQRYHGQGVGQASSGAQIVSTMKEATDLTLSTSTASRPNPTPKSLKSPNLPRAATITTPKSPTSPPSPVSPSMTLNVSYSENTSSQTSPVSTLAGTLMAARSGLHSAAEHSAPTPSPKPTTTKSSSQSAEQSAPIPKPASTGGVAAAAAAEKQKFAPTWHSQAKAPKVDDEPIYGPTPRRISFTTPTLKKRDVSSSSSDFPEPVYEIIPEPEVEVYLTVAEFTATAGDGISFEAGQECTVVTKNPAGWWYVDMDGQEGWVPSSYLERKPSSPTPSQASAKSPTSPNVPPVPEKKSRKDPPKKEVKKEEVKKDSGKAAVRDEFRKKDMLRKEPMMKANAKNSPIRPRKMSLSKASEENSPIRPRKMSLSKASEKDPPPRPLRRSTSTDSGLYEEVGFKKKEVTALASPPAVRRTSHVPPKPSRPKNTPTLPNTKTTTISNFRSPQGDRKTIKTTISGPMPFQPSPNTKKRSDATAPPLKTRKVSPAKSVSTLGASKPASTLGARSPPAKPASQPTIKRGGSNDDSWEMVDNAGASRNHHLKSKNRSSPELRVKDIPARRGTGDLLSSPGVKRPPPTHKRRGSADSNTGMAYKQELAKKLMEKPTSNTTKRPSPPNRPKAPPTKQPVASGKARPSRPNPPRPAAAAGKKPPPPRPYTAPAAKKAAYVTIGEYTGDDGSCLTFSDGEEVEVLEKNADGWWFIKIGNREGWAPSTYIEEQASPGPTRPHPPRPRSPPPAAGGTATLPGSKASSKKVDTPTEEDLTHPKPKPRPRPRKATSVFCRATDSFEGEDSGLSLVQGRVYELKEKNDSGWWLMKDGDIEGWAPSNHLKEV